MLFDVLWGIILLSIILSWFHLLTNWHKFVGTDMSISNPYPRLIFAIASKHCPPLIHDSIRAIHDAASTLNYNNYVISVITENPDVSFEEAKCLLVPPEYQCRSQYKARVLNYALSTYPNTPDTWIYHLDEDAHVTSQGLRSIFAYIKGGGQPIANGPTVFPPQRRRDVLLTLGEAQRHWTFYWLQSQLKAGNPLWLNGSNLLIRSDVEHTIGWDFEGCPFGEDSRFGYEARRRLGKVFGWHGGLTIEQQPASILAIMKQRCRWFTSARLYIRYNPDILFLRGRRLYSIICWICGAILSLLALPRFLFNIDPYLLPYSLFIVSSIFWILRFALSIYRNTQYASLPIRERLWYFVMIVPCIGIVELICTVPVLWALIKPPKTFEITTKRDIKQSEGWVPTSK